MIQEKLEPVGRERMAPLGLLKREVFTGRLTIMDTGLDSDIPRGSRGNYCHQGLWGPLMTVAIKRALSDSL